MDISFHETIVCVFCKKLFIKHEPTPVFFSWSFLLLLFCFGSSDKIVLSNSVAFIFLFGHTKNEQKGGHWPLYRYLGYGRMEQKPQNTILAGMVNTALTTQKQKDKKECEHKINTNPSEPLIQSSNIHQLQSVYNNGVDEVELERNLFTFNKRTFCISIGECVNNNEGVKNTSFVFKSISVDAQIFVVF